MLSRTPSPQSLCEYPPTSIPLSIILIISITKISDGGRKKNKPGPRLSFLYLWSCLLICWSLGVSFKIHVFCFCLDFAVCLVCNTLAVVVVLSPSPHAHHLHHPHSVIRAVRPQLRVPFFSKCLVLLGASLISMLPFQYR